MDRFGHSGRASGHCQFSRFKHSNFAENAGICHCYGSGKSSGDVLYALALSGVCVSTLAVYYFYECSQFVFTKKEMSQVGRDLWNLIRSSY